MQTNERTSVILADDHALFRNGLRTLLENNCGVQVLAEAEDGQQLLDIYGSIEPDIIILDIDMPIMDGFDAAREILGRNPEQKIITLSMHGDEQYYFRMVDIGAKGFLLKSSDLEEVRTAIRTVRKGGTFFSQELLQNIVGTLNKPTGHEKGPGEEEVLSQRELEILDLICNGYSNHEIADRLFISKRTVDKHRANILAKTDCKNTANLVIYAVKNSLITI